MCRCPVSKEELSAALQKVGRAVVAVYLTSPDYLGGLLDIKGLAQAVHQYGTLLLVDNAHGAYQHFLTPASHPLDLGADLCCGFCEKSFPFNSRKCIKARKSIALIHWEEPSAE